MFILLLGLLSAATMAEEFIVEKTFPRGNTFCSVQKKRVEFELRGSSRYTDARERGFGEYAFYIIDKQHHLLPLNKERMDSYKFFKGEGSLCSKSYAYQITDKSLAILFLKENGPFPGKLTLQLFNTDSSTPGEVVETNYLTDKVVNFKNGFAFPSLEEKLDVENGKVTIEDTKYLYQNRSMTPWMSYTAAGFVVEPTLSFTKSEWKRFFKDEKEFLETFEWNKEEKKFKKTVLYTAFNHGVKKKCILPVSNRQQLTGMEKWICR